jgi:chromosome segregation ATPase
MKKIVLLAVVFMFFGTSVFSQKYKTASDTAKLNKEYASVLKDVSDLTSKLTTAQNDLPGNQSKAADALKDSEKATGESNGQTATTDVGDAKKAKKKADKAYKEAKNSEKSQERVRDQEKKIAKLTEELSKKQLQLQELETMRTTIRNRQ